MKEDKQPSVLSFTFGSYMKYERRQYEIMGFRLPRALSWRLIGYYGLILGVFLFIRIFPLTGWLVKRFADSYYLAYYVVFPILMVWGLDQYKTDGKSFLAFLRSWSLFRIRTHRMSRFARIPKPKKYVFASPLFIQYGANEPMPQSKFTSTEPQPVHEFPLTFIQDKEGMKHAESIDAVSF